MTRTYTARMAFAVGKLLLAARRGYCAGVDRAVQTVERALELYVIKALAVDQL